MAAGRKKFPDAKILVLGSKGVGKTSLVKRLRGGRINPNEPESKRLKIDPWIFRSTNLKFHFNIWDFGREEIKYNTYRVFLTKYTLCLFVVNSNNTEPVGQLKRTLQDIRKFGNSPPIIIVINKIDQAPQKVTKEILDKNFASVISKVVEVSCMTNTGIDELKKIIVETSTNLDFVQGEIPDKWTVIKQYLENSTQSYILKNDFEEICKIKKFHNPVEQRRLLHYLHHLGIASNFQNICILKPNWIASGLHKICNNNLMFQNKGVLDEQIASQILDEKAYPKIALGYLIDIMRDFELCFDIDNKHDTGKVLIPFLLLENEAFTNGWHPDLSFQYEYSLLPDSLISRFIAKSLTHDEPKTYWRNGIVFKKDKNAALVKAMPEQNIIHVQFNKLEARHEFSPVIQTHLEQVHQSVPELGDIKKTDLVQLSQGDTTNKRQQKATELFDQLKKMKQNLDLKSEQKIKELLRWFIILLVLIWANLGLAIYIYGWNKIEPLVYMGGLGLGILSYLGFIGTLQEFSPTAIYKKLVELEKIQTYKENEFDLTEYERLKRQCVSKSTS